MQSRSSQSFQGTGTNSKLSIRVRRAENASQRLHKTIDGNYNPRLLYASNYLLSEAFIFLFINKARIRSYVTFSYQPICNTTDISHISLATNEEIPARSILQDKGKSNDNDGKWKLSTDLRHTRRNINIEVARNLTKKANTCRAEKTRSIISNIKRTRSYCPASSVSTLYYLVINNCPLR